jgi:hypothetical protein
MGNIFSENIPWSVGIVIGLFGIIAVHRLVLFRDKRKAFVSASTELVSSFAPAISRIDAAILHVGTLDAPDVNKFLSDNFETHSAAVRRFGSYITSRRRRKTYEKAWKEYCDLEPYSGGITLFAGHHVHQNGRHLEFIKEKVEHILKFANPRMNTG